MKCGCPYCHVEIGAGGGLNLCRSCRLECAVPTPPVHAEPAPPKKKRARLWAPFLSAAAGSTGFCGVAACEAAYLGRWFLFFYILAGFVGWAALTCFLARAFVREVLLRKGKP